MPYNCALFILEPMEKYDFLNTDNGRFGER